MLSGKSPPNNNQTAVLTNIINNSQQDIVSLLQLFHTSLLGLSEKEKRKRLSRYGHNTIAQEKHELWLIKLIKMFNNPLVIMLIILALISRFTGDHRSEYVIYTMVILGIVLRFFQEYRADNAVKKLITLVRTTCTVVRGGVKKEVPLQYIVPGDIIQLAAGDIVPADIRLIESKDLFINQAALTGEALPVEKHARLIPENIANPLELPNICFMGTNVESGTANAVVIATGNQTYFGHLAQSIIGKRSQTSFDKGVNQFTWLMLRFMLVMSPTVFLINGLSKGNWWAAFLFAISIAVGLTPEMLPMIVSVNLSKGAIEMAKKSVIMKRLSSIQNFGAMDILCTDKTGTLTQNKVALVKYIDANANTDINILKLAYLNSFFQSGFNNLMDRAIMEFTKKNGLQNLEKDFQKVDEIPFDFARRRISVVVKNNQRKILICKGAVEEVFAICTHVQIGNKTFPLNKENKDKIQALTRQLSNDGFRVVTVAQKEIKGRQNYFNIQDEHSLIIVGLMAFFDPPKDTAEKAIQQLMAHGIKVKILTGDNELVTQKVCKEVNLVVENTLLGEQIEKMTDAQLQTAVETTTIFAKLSPDHKKRVINALKNNKHVVGFLGDGINDAPALREADVGISVNTAVDIAKESADVVLLEMSLLVLEEGVIEGRKVFANIIKYIKMGASSNFGNMFSVIGGSLFLPFLPMEPIQILTNNLLYDFSQTAIPTDNVDKEFLEKPRKWDINSIKKFMIFIGPISSIFDYATYFTMLFIFNCWKNPALFHTGWFVESLMTQTMIIHVIRTNKIPFIQSRASLPLILTTIIIVSIGIGLTFSPLAKSLGFVRLPLLYWPILALMLIAYYIITQLVKIWFIKKFGNS